MAKEQKNNSLGLQVTPREAQAEILEFTASKLFLQVLLI